MQSVLQVALRAESSVKDQRVAAATPLRISLEVESGSHKWRQQPVVETPVAFGRPGSAAALFVPAHTRMLGRHAWTVSCVVSLGAQQFYPD